MSRIHNVESLACAVAKLVAAAEAPVSGVRAKAIQTAEAVMDKIQDLIREDSQESVEDPDA